MISFWSARLILINSAVLRGNKWIRRACGNGRVYPALVPNEDEDLSDDSRSGVVVEGKVITGLTERDMLFLDAFEDEYYKVWSRSSESLLVA